MLHKPITQCLVPTLRVGTRSSIRSIGYDRARLILEIEFQSGRVYRYYDVPLAEFRRLWKAASKGSYFNASIRGSYPYTRRVAS